MNPQADYILDTCGLMCPEPVMLLHNKIRELQAGEVLQVVATDPSTTRDIPKFCTFLQHELIAQEQNDTQYIYYIRKGAEAG
ncbi:sulfurtransferase TusA [Zooshikella harenae]|uniref:Sulfur carrier protein TusA n=1 Tax=Zooshikella harenae TaxID=2827238 RepID=A0ABS5Z952_9GAMM|nr:sulfurtransferase TusA [Zooshikella harenae]MBU2709830.1 sulfurtransferase TusA [Zooshikella harenae]